MSYTVGSFDLGDDRVVMTRTYEQFNVVSTNKGHSLNQTFIGKDAIVKATESFISWQQIFIENYAEEHSLLPDDEDVLKHWWLLTFRSEFITVSTNIGSLQKYLSMEDYGLAGKHLFPNTKYMCVGVSYLGHMSRRTFTAPAEPLNDSTGII